MNLLGLTRPKVMTPGFRNRRTSFSTRRSYTRVARRLMSLDT
jgi:hypothetical protein